MQFLLELLCSVPAQVDMSLQEWRFTRGQKVCAANQPMDRLQAAIVGGLNHVRKNVRYLDETGWDLSM